MQTKAEITGSLAHWLAAGKLDGRVVLPAVEGLALEGTPPVSLIALLESVVSQPAQQDVTTLASHLRTVCRRESLAARARRVSGQDLDPASAAALGGVPLDASFAWRNPRKGVDLITVAVQAAGDAFRAEKSGDASPELTRAALERLRKTSAEALVFLRREGGILNHRLLGAAQSANRVGCPDEVVLALTAWVEDQEVAARLEAAEAVDGLRPAALENVDDALAMGLWTDRWNRTKDIAERGALLNLLCSWPTPRASSELRTRVEPGWMEERAQVILSYRFGQGGLGTWPDWCGWMRGLEPQWIAQAGELEECVRSHAAMLLWLWYRMEDTQVASVEAWLRDGAAECVPAEPLLPPKLPPLLAVQVIPAVEEERVAAPIVPVPIEAPQPSVWDRHIQPFFAANGYMLAGIGMVIVGSSLVALYTWDKHWLVRYSVMPALLALFTWALARAGQWIEDRDRELRSMGAMLRGAALGLLPINFMAIALLSGDPEVSQRGLAVSVMVAIYVAFFGWGLRRWCSAVHPQLGQGLGTGLLLINSLVVLISLARSLAGIEGDTLWNLIAAGFHLGFAVVVGVVVWFSRRVLDVEMAGEKRVPWFVGGTLALTYFQVFAWVHGYLRHLPEISTYALVVIAAGGLMLYAEGVSLRLRRMPDQHEAESFLGFAMILMGLLMAAAEPRLRIAAFLMAGLLWLWRAFRRDHAAHYWIGLTLLVLGTSSVTLLQGYPAQWRAPAGVVISLILILVPRSGLGRRSPAFDQACQGMQAAVLSVTTLVAVLAQWRDASPPLTTGLSLVVVAGLFIWRALRHSNLSWLHTAMVVLALALPYLGFAQIGARTWHGNTMACGLGLVSCLWLLANSVIRHPLLREARSTVLMFYGALAVAAMLLRVGLGDSAPQPLWYRDYMEYGGPFLMAAALVFGTYYSRSHVMAWMGTVIAVILFPELRGNLRGTFPALAWGTGLGSALSAVGLVVLCFRLRQWPRLRELRDGDRLFGREAFPFTREDSTLFTTPILFAAIYLIVRVETWDLVRNWHMGGLSLRTATALLVTSLAWMLIAVFRRDRSDARVAVHLGWAWGAVGIVLGYWGQSRHPEWCLAVILAAAWLEGLYRVGHHGMSRRWPWIEPLIVGPIRELLPYACWVMLSASFIGLFAGEEWQSLQWLILFAGVQCVRHGLERREAGLGYALFAMGWVTVLAAASPLPGPLFVRLSAVKSLMPTLQFLTVIQILWVALEARAALFEKLESLVAPMAQLASTLVVLLGIGVILDAVWPGTSLASSQVLMLLLLLVTARAHRSGYTLLLGLLLAGILVQGIELGSLGIGIERFMLLTSPWRVASVVLGMVLAAILGTAASKRLPRMFYGARPIPFLFAPSLDWIFHPAVVLALAAEVYHSIDPVHRQSALQLATPFVGAAACLVAGIRGRRGWVNWVAGSLWAVGNLHLVRVLGGDWLLSQGLSSLHLICLGLGVSLAQLTLLRRWVGVEAVMAALDRSASLLAGLILALLSANYAVASNLENFTTLRLVSSGTLACMAAWHFRRDARRADVTEGAQGSQSEGLYHYGLVLGLWCAALLIPWLRQPAMALVALSLPLFVFHVLAEVACRRGLSSGKRYGNSAAVLGFVLLALYVFRGVVHMVMFPDIPIPTAYYHRNAPLLVAIAFVLLRLNALGGSRWLAFYGGLSLMTGSYFVLTAFPGLSPFEHPVAAAWMAVLSAQFWITVSHERSPLRTLIQRCAGLDEAAWHGVRRVWGVCLVVAVHVAGAWGLTDAKALMVAPLFAGVASVVLHQGILRRSRVSWAIAVLEMALALHMDFLVPSWLEWRLVVWVLIGLLAWVRVARVLQHRWVESVRAGVVMLFLGILILFHVMVHRPWSVTGLWAVGMLGALAAFHPLRRWPARESHEPLFSVAVALVPTWLVFFGLSAIPEEGIGAALQPWPILTAVLTLLLTGLGLEHCQVGWATAWRVGRRTRAYLLDALEADFMRRGERVMALILIVAFLVVTGIQWVHYNRALTPGEWALTVGLHAGMAWLWYRRNLRAPSVLASVGMQLGVAAALVGVRRQLMLTTSLWSVEYDVWLSLAVSAFMTGARGAWSRQPRPVAFSFVVTLCALPVLAMGWVLFHGLGSDLALLVVGAHSLMFAYLGRSDRESPYTMVALGGFVLFILMSFWTKLEVRAVHAYVIPVGLGILVLVHMLRERMAASTRNGVRLTTMLAMLGSSGYYAIADPRYPVTFNLTLILLCLAAMGLGSVLSVRVYLAVGFSGILVSLVNLMARGLLQADRGVRMTVVGSLVLLLGAGLVFGAIYWRTHQSEIEAWLGRWRARFGSWE